MDDYIAFYLVVGGNGSKYSKYIRIKITEEITNSVVGAAGYGRIKILDDYHILHI